MATEKRLIDANALKSNMCEYCNKYFSEEPCEPSECVFIQFVNEQPTMDAVEVVRCKDCKHYEEDTMWCKVNSNPRSATFPNWYADDFCSYGEREDNEQT